MALLHVGHGGGIVPYIAVMSCFRSVFHIVIAVSIGKDNDRAVLRICMGTMPASGLPTLLYTANVNKNVLSGQILGSDGEVNKLLYCPGCITLDALLRQKTVPFSLLTHQRRKLFLMCATYS